MKDASRANQEKRIIVLAPTGKDGALTRSILERAGLACHCCSDLPQVCAELDAGVGALLLAEEAVGNDRNDNVVEWLAHQPTWSDLAVLVLARPGADSAAVARAMDLLGNVTVLERPMRVAALVSAVRAALRGRQRQYQIRAQIAEREHRDRDLRDFFDNAPIGIHAAGPDGIILSVNQTELEMLGYTREEYVGHSILDFHADAPVIHDILARLARGETIRNREARLQGKHGSIRHVLINANVLWEGERFVHTRCFTRDISDRKAAEEAQSRLAAIVASSDDAIISKTLWGTILTWNAGAERLFGYSAAEAVGQPITMLIPRDRLGEEPVLLERLGRGERVDPFETVRLAKNGRRIDISLTVSPVLDASGSIVSISKVARDISHSKRAAEALRAVQEQLQVVTDNMAVAVTRCSRDLRYLWVSPGCAAWLNRPAEVMIGKSIPEDIGAAAFETIRPHVERVLSGERVEFEALVPYQGLEPRWVKAVYVPTHDSSGLTDGWVAVVIDTSVHHKLEGALREADRRKDEFLAILAHELRNPLAPIRNSLHILRMNGGADPRLATLTEIMDRQVNHMVRLVDDLLEVSRITRGKIELRKERVEVAAMIRSAVEVSRPLIDAGGHRLSIEMPAMPLTLDADPVRLAQVFANLLNNAAKYTNKGGQIWLSVRPDGNQAVVSVRDTGCGISAEVLPRVFELFMQVDHAPGRAQGGLGIGLTLVKCLVEMHSGTVEAVSAGREMGSEFVVRLPLAANVCEFQHADSGPRPISALASRRVLVVDDNHDAADSLGALLRLLGVEVQIAYSGAEALSVLSSYHPAVVLLDIGMPGMDGHEVARRIRRQPEFQDVMLVALTGWGQKEDIRRTRAAGFDHHLVKPADIDALQTLLFSLNDNSAASSTSVWPLL